MVGFLIPYPAVSYERQPFGVVKTFCHGEGGTTNLWHNGLIPLRSDDIASEEFRAVLEDSRRFADRAAQDLHYPGSSFLAEHDSLVGQMEDLAGDLEVFRGGVDCLILYPIFVCYNQEFDGLWGGKCSYKFQLKQDGKSIWSKTGRNRNNTPAIEYAKSFRLEVSGGGAVSISDEIPSKDLAHLQRLIDHLESELVASAPKKSLQVMRAMDLAQTVLGAF